MIVIILNTGSRKVVYVQSSLRYGNFPHLSSDMSRGRQKKLNGIFLWVLQKLQTTHEDINIFTMADIKDTECIYCSLSRDIVQWSFHLVFHIFVCHFTALIST